MGLCAWLNIDFLLVAGICLFYVLSRCVYLHIPFLYSGSTSMPSITTP